jgi:hypothetical protein
MGLAPLAGIEFAAAPRRLQAQDGAGSWLATLQKRLPEYGHRNWVVIADSAYPLQSNPGIETIVSESDHLRVLHTALELISKMPHVRPVIYTDKELQFVPDADVPGITAYRQRLAAMLNNQPVQTMPHEQIIHTLDEAARTFNVLIIKTTLTMPYTSVFLQLAAAYWSDDAESRLRQSMSGR